MDRKKLPVAVLTFIVLAAIGLFYFVFDPATWPWMPRCFFHSVTGLQCPGCGSQRMLHALLHGDFASAWHANALALVSLPFLGFGVWLEINRTSHPALYAKTMSTPVIITVSVILLGWFIARNMLSTC